MKNISSLRDCYGCGVCIKVCPKHIIKLKLNAEGFYQPYIIDKDSCVDCGICLEVCSFADKFNLESHVISSYAAWSNDDNMRSKCSSGGIGYEIGRYLLERNYKVCAVRYNSKENFAEHYIAENISELTDSIGSKYIQSYSAGAFMAIKKGEKYLITGTPCQISSFRKYIKKFNIANNFILMDFFCHGVPSMLLWQKYIRDVEKKVGKITSVKWRNKIDGWLDSYNIEIIGDNSDCGICNKNGAKERVCVFRSKKSEGDSFYDLFLSDSCLNKPCYDSCKFKYDKSDADIRIGDLWGKTYIKEKNGVSAAIAFTENGHKILNSLNCTLISHPFELVAEGQMKQPSKRGNLYKKIQELLMDNNTTIHELHCCVLKEKKRLRNIDRIKHPFRTLCNILRRVKNENKNYNLS